MVKDSNFSFKDLKNKTFLLTGSANGIGRCMAKCLAGQGANLILFDKDIDRQKTLEVELKREFSQQKIQSIFCDLSIEEEREKSLNDILQSYYQIDGIIHNAAIDPRNSIEKTNMIFLHKVFAVKFDTAVHFIQKLLPILKKSNSGRIILMGSVTNELGVAHLSAYASANAAISGLTRTLAHELGEFNITVNCINPGSIAVEKNKEALDSDNCQVVINSQSISRQIYPEDLMGLICLLLSVSSSFITAQNFTVDGGLMPELSKKTLQEGVSGSN